MTTIIGLKTTVGLDAIVLASDFTKTFICEDNSMEFGEMKKIYTTPNFAFAFSGHVNPELLTELWGNLKNKKNNENYIDFKMRLKDKFFDEARKLNQIQSDSDKELIAKNQTQFVFATRYNKKLGLHKVYPLGKIEENNSNYVCIGSGSEYIIERLDEKYEFKSLDGPKIDLRKAVKMAQKNIKRANKDMFTGSEIVDFSIITKNSVKYFGNKLRKDLKSYKNKQIDEIIKSYY
jgi:20S proteasome alpha/beta subunit